MFDEPSTSLRRCSLAALVLALVLAPVVGVVPTVAADAGAPEGEIADVERGNLTALLPPPGADDLRAIERAAAAGDLTPTEAVHHEGTVVFRLNADGVRNRTAARVGDGLDFRLKHTKWQYPSRAPRTLDASDSGDAVRAFAADGSLYVAVDLQNASWVSDYDTPRELDRKPPRPKEGYTANATLTVGNDTVTRTTQFVTTEPELTNEPTTDARGVAELRVTMPGTRAASVVVANESSGYRDAIGVYDRDNDGNVTLRFDTTLAGNPEGAPAPFSAVGADATELPDTQRPRFDGVLPAGSYRIAVSEGDPADTGRFSSTLTVTERSVGDLTPLVAPAGTTFPDGEAVEAAIDAGTLTPARAVATTDTLVFRLNASGVDGLASAGSLLGDELRVDLLRRDDSVSSDGGHAERAVNASAGAVDAVATPEAVYVVVDLPNATLRRPDGSVAPAVDAGATVRARLTLTGDATAGANATRNTSVEAVEPRVTVGVPVRAPAGGNATVTVGSSLAPGSVLIVAVDGSAARAVVEESGVARASVSLAAYNPEETATVRATTVGSPRVNDTGSLTVVAPETPTATRRPTTTEAPGFGVVTALAALATALVRRR